MAVELDVAELVLEQPRRCGHVVTLQAVSGSCREHDCVRVQAGVASLPVFDLGVEVVFNIQSLGSGLDAQAEVLADHHDFVTHLPETPSTPDHQVVAQRAWDVIGCRKVVSERGVNCQAPQVGPQRHVTETRLNQAELLKLPQHRKRRRSPAIGRGQQATEFMDHHIGKDDVMFFEALQSVWIVD